MPMATVWPGATTVPVAGRPLTVYGADGAVTGIFVQGHDMTERRKAEEEVKRLNQTLERRVQARTAELVEANKGPESFSYSVGHDLRAPLRHITGFAQLLERRIGKTLDDTAREYMKTISEAARQGGKMVDDLLNFSRMGRAELRKSQVSLDELVEQVPRERHDMPVDGVVTPNGVVTF